jgi:hypothetical protein
LIEEEGKSCVEIEALARLTNGALSSGGNQITLTLHGARASREGSQGFSKDFLSAAIVAMFEILESRSALETAVRYGFPSNDDWVNQYRGAATSSVRQASVAASTESDRDAAQLISKDLDHMQQLSEKMVSERKKMTYIAPAALTNDPLDKKILNCAQSLAAMAASGQFYDDGPCH